MMSWVDLDLEPGPRKLYARMTSQGLTRWGIALGNRRRSSSLAQVPWLLAPLLPSLHFRLSELHGVFRRHAFDQGVLA